MNDLQKILAKKNNKLESLYHQRVVELIRKKYSINEELSILRKRDSNKAEFEEYDSFVEACKIEAKEESGL